MLKLKSLSLFGIIGGITLLSATSLSAATLDVNAPVEIVDALNVTEIKGLNFGQVVKPSSATEYVTISPAGAVSNSATIIPASSPARSAGQYTISGGNAKVSISVTNLNGSTPELTLKDVTYEYNGTSGTFNGLPLTGQSSSGTLNLGATLDIASTIDPGTYSPSFTIVVDYE